MSRSPPGQHVQTKDLSWRYPRRLSPGVYLYGHLALRCARIENVLLTICSTFFTRIFFHLLPARSICSENLPELIFTRIHMLLVGRTHRFPGYSSYAQRARPSKAGKIPLDAVRFDGLAEMRHPIFTSGRKGHAELGKTTCCTAFYVHRTQPISNSSSRSIFRQS